MNGKMSVYDTRERGNSRYVPTSTMMAKATRAFSSSQSKRSSGAMAAVVHSTAYTAQRMLRYRVRDIGRRRCSFAAV
jgi:hypothetical protein